MAVLLNLLGNQITYVFSKSFFESFVKVMAR